jgi:hypothetical protein
MPSLFKAGVFTTMTFKPTIGAIQIAFTSQAAQGGVIIADYAPRIDLFVKLRS